MQGTIVLAPFRFPATFLAVSYARKERPIKLTPLQHKKACQEQAELRLQAAFAKANRAKRAQERSPTKRKDNAALAHYVSLPLHNDRAVRSAETHRVRSHNLARQALSLVDHLFVLYPVPRFLYRAILSAPGRALVFDAPAKSNPETAYREWFLVVAQGGSFAKAARDVFTKREAHLFLQAPDGNDIVDNVFWARAAAAGVPRNGCDYLVMRLEPSVRHALRNRLPDLLRFYAEAWGEMRDRERDEITDFVRAMAGDPAFSFKGRTLGSMRKRCLEWHRTAFVRGVREYRFWNARLAAWSTQKRGLLVRAEELTNNRQLADEGAVQRHCVYSYAGMCAQGRCAIVSLRWYEVAGESVAVRDANRLTVEVSMARREVMQIRGRMNRRATLEEMRIVRHWTGDLGLTIAPNA